MHHDQAVTVREAHERLAELLDAAEGGQEIVVTDRGQPKARIVPPLRPSAPLRVDIGWLESLPVNPSTASADLYIREDRDSRN